MKTKHIYCALLAAALSLLASASPAMATPPATAMPRRCKSNDANGVVVPRPTEITFRRVLAGCPSRPSQPAKIATTVGATARIRWRSDPSLQAQDAEWREGDVLCFPDGVTAHVDVMSLYGHETAHVGLMSLYGDKASIAIRGGWLEVNRIELPHPRRVQVSVAKIAMVTSSRSTTLCAVAYVHPTGILTSQNAPLVEATNLALGEVTDPIAQKYAVTFAETYDSQTGKSNGDTQAAADSFDDMGWKKDWNSGVLYFALDYRKNGDLLLHVFRERGAGDRPAEKQDNMDSKLWTQPETFAKYYELGVYKLEAGSDPISNSRLIGELGAGSDPSSGQRIYFATGGSMWPKYNSELGENTTFVAVVEIDWED